MQQLNAKQQVVSTAILLVALFLSIYNTSAQTISLFAGPIFDGVPATQAPISSFTTGMAIDHVQNCLYFCDSNHHRLRMINLTSSIISTVAGVGNWGFAGDNGPSNASLLFRPEGVVLDLLRNVIYISDGGNSRIRMINRTNNIITTVAGNGFNSHSGDNGQATLAGIGIPNNLALDVMNNLLFTTDSATNRIRVVNRTSGIITTFAGNGLSGYNGDNGPAISARLFQPSHVALDLANNLVFIADTSNHAIRVVNRTSMIITTLGGDGIPGNVGDNFNVSSARFNRPESVVFDAASNLLYIADASNNRVRVVNRTSGIIAAFAGTGISGFLGDNGPALLAQMSTPTSIALDSRTNMLYITDRINTRIRVVDTISKNISTFAGSTLNGFEGENSPANGARLNIPQGSTMDSNFVYFADTNNNRIRSIGKASGIISTTAGSVLGYLDNVLANVSLLNGPEDVSMDAVSNLLYIADTRNHCIRVLNLTSGLVTRFAGIQGQNGYNGDYILANASRLSNPRGVHVDSVTNMVYIADSSNNRVRAVNRTSGIITTVAGTGTGGYNGDTILATTAQLNSPNDVFTDPTTSMLYIADRFNNRVRAVNLITGLISTFAGNGLSGFDGDNGIASNARLSLPHAIHIDVANRHMYISDSINYKIRTVHLVSEKIITVAGTASSGYSGDFGPISSFAMSNSYGIVFDATRRMAYISDSNNHRMRAALLCPMGTITTSVGSCLPCSTGYFANFFGASSCDACEVGTFADTQGSAFCQKCTAGTYSFSIAANSSSYCLPCEPGYYSLAGATSCIPCGIGTFANTSGTATCSPCGFGTFASTAGAIQCSLCSLGTFSTVIGANSASSCQPCGRGTYNDVQGSSSCKPCQKGSYSIAFGSTSIATCTLCERGTFAPNSFASQCQLCPQGTFANTTGSAMCTPCPITTFNAGTGGNSSENCQSCPSGSFSTSIGASSCQACPAGSVSSIGQSFCTPCQAGTYSNFTSCVLCSAGTYSSVSGAQSSAYCVPCPLGAVSQAGSSFCQQCSSGSYSPTIGGTLCIPCSIGTFAPSAGASTCKSCSAGTYASSTGSSTCQSCPSGTASSVVGATDATTCLPCSAGFFASGIGSNECQSCPIGSFMSSSGASSCTPCAAGSFADKPGTVQCSACIAGSFSIFVGAVSNTTCTKCPIGTFSAFSGASSIAFCQPCQGGTFASTVGSASCSSCSQGTFSTVIGATSNTSCELCSLGTFNNGVGRSTCTLCPVATYADTVGSVACKDCHSTTVSPQGSSSIAACKPCSAGSFMLGEGPSKICKLCPIGTSSNVVGASTADSCKVCLPGSYSDVEGATECKKCTIGSISTILGATSCSTCERGYSSPIGGIECVKCKAGSFENGTNGCVSCLPGTHANTDGLTMCNTCAEGFYARGGASICIPCANGFFSASKATFNCTPCATGTFTNQTGSTSCNPCNEYGSCPLGTRSPLPASLLASDTSTSGDPYFTQQKKQIEFLQSPELAKAIIIVICICIVLLVALVSIISLIVMLKCKAACFKFVKTVLQFVDFFSLKHFVPYNKSPVRESTMLGGVMTILLCIIAITVTSITLIDVTQIGNITESTHVVPKEVVNVTAIHGTYLFHLYLYNYGEPEKCNPKMIIPPGLQPTSLLHTNAHLLFNGTCFVNISCHECYLSGVSHEFLFTFDDYLAMASAMEYSFQFPHFTSRNATVIVNERLIPNSNTSVFRGPIATQVSLTLTTSLYQTISATDFFFYNLYSKLFKKETNQRFEGYSAVRNPTLRGSELQAATFWNSSSVQVQFLVSINPNANLIQQQGKVTILDFFSKIFALIAAASGLLQLVMVILEEIYLKIRNKMQSNDKPTSETEMQDKLENENTNESTS